LPSRLRYVFTKLVYSERASNPSGIPKWFRDKKFKPTDPAAVAAAAAAAAAEEEGGGGAFPMKGGPVEGANNAGSAADLRVVDFEVYDSGVVTAPLHANRAVAVHPAATGDAEVV
jgi:hypothetical protein